MATWNDNEDVASKPYSWRAECLEKMAANPKAVIISEVAAPGKIVAVNAAWTELCGYAPEEALGQCPSLLQGEATSKTKARAYTRQVLASRTLSEDNGFASRRGRSSVKLINYSKSGRPFVHCLKTSRVMDEDTGVEYFLTESQEETDAGIRRAMLAGEEARSQKPIRDGAIYLALVSIALSPAVLPVLQALMTELGLAARTRVGLPRS